MIGHYMKNPTLKWGCGNDMEREPKTTSEEMVEAIDRGIAEAQAITIEDALYMAVEQGRMSIKDAQECIEAYQRAFKQ